MTTLTNLIYTEKWRPNSFDDLILKDKEVLIKHLKENSSIPSFIFYSSRPGTGKTTAAKIISTNLNCDTLSLNSSDERGIDTIRDKIKLFAQSLSSNITSKRLVFCDESDGLTSQSQDCLRNLMETYSDNVFFIFSCNDINKIKEPIRSRCVVINFEAPDKQDILKRLEFICQSEEIEYDIEDLSKLVKYNYPDIRSMILAIQTAKIDKRSLSFQDENNVEFLSIIKKKDIATIYKKVYNSEVNIQNFNKWLWHYLYTYNDKFTYEQLRKISILLADTEKQWNLGVNLEIIFISNILQIAEVL